MIPQQFIEEVQARTDIVDLISTYIPLKRTGRNFKALCPFHNEKTPSFFVSPQKQIFHCFGCGEGGGVIQFLMLFEKVSFVEAVEILAKRLGLEIPYQRTTLQDRLKTVLYELTDEASKFFFATLLTTPQGEEARRYFLKRGIDSETIRQFRLGYAPGRNTLLEFMRKKGYNLEILEKASLVIPKREGGYLDMFRERIIFPIFDVKGRAVGFGARILRESKDIPKYINSLENPIYEKRSHLYGFNFSKEEISKRDWVIVVEGYFDMITLYREGIKNIVASLGTALTLEQINLLKRYTKNIVLIFDSDKAGQLATLRALDLLLENGLKIEIVKMPQGFDPDSFVRKKGKEKFQELLQEKLDFFDYKIKILKDTYDLDSIDGKSTVAEEMLRTINRIHREIEKYEYIKKLASLLSVREEVLLLELNRMKEPAYQKSPLSVKKKMEKSPMPITEKLLIQFILASKKAAKVIKRNLDVECFSHPLARKIISLLFDNFIGNESLSVNTLLGMIEDKEVTSFISQLLLEDKVSLTKKLLKDCILKLRQRRIKILKEELRKKIKEAESKRDGEKVKELITRYKELKSEVR
ncbi:MAG: DNA primase [Candidatus Omnitrophica bacterium]|nr:DNA primase [Candidatus Omnitrophota bacterium]